MTPDQHVAAITAGREAVQRILDEALPGETAP